uniref:Uncharacterized protein n=1 Tax=Lactuca sativa TaxID=4236 RepID=A0A9R1VAQ2_LACSA|nr:hypothetical protein LSAT_V11C500297660 [Lactuca sativa]
MIYMQHQSWKDLMMKRKVMILKPQHIDEVTLKILSISRVYSSRFSQGYELLHQRKPYIQQEVAQKEPKKKLKIHIMNLHRFHKATSMENQIKGKD